MRRILGLPSRPESSSQGPGVPKTLKVGAGDILTWRHFVMEVTAALSIDKNQDLCLLNDGTDHFLVIFETDRGLLWQADPSDFVREWPIRAESIWDGQPIRVRSKDDRVIIQWGSEHFVADLTTPGSHAEWVNSFGRPHDTSSAMEITPYIDPKESHR